MCIRDRDGADASEERVGLVSKSLDLFERSSGGKPCSRAGARSDLTIEGERGFQSNERQAGANPLGKTFVGRPGPLCETFDEVNFDARAFQRCEASPSNLRIRVLHRRINIFYFGCNDGFRARTGAACGAAVSYTHLDVYKRQVVAFGN